MKKLSIIIGIIILGTGCIGSKHIANEKVSFTVVDSTSLFYEDVNSPGKMIPIKDTLIVTVVVKYKKMRNVYVKSGYTIKHK